jgi:exodeoxyribonuclease VII large subunit
MRHAKLAARLQPRLLEIRIARAADRLEALARRSGDGLARLTAHRRTRLERLTGRLTPELVRGRMSRAAERVETLAERARRALENGITARRRALDGTSGLLRSLSYQSVLGRGFALVRDSAGQAVRSIRQVKAGAVVSVEVADGRFAAQALEGGTSSEPKTLKAAQPAATPSPPRKREGGGGSQGSLF